MANGIAVYGSDGVLVWDMTGILGRVVGTASVVYAAGATGVRTVTIAGISESDTAILSTSTNYISVVSVSISGSTVVVDRASTYSAPAVTYRIHVLRL